MKSRIRKSTYKAIYRLLNVVSPVDYDCGSLCGAACCTCGRGPESEINPDEYSFGIYLLPGEDKIFTKKESWLGWGSCDAEDYEFPESWHGKVWFLDCKNPPHCDRKMRPIQCRTFPITPHINEDGELQMIYNPIELPYSCPLIDKKSALNDSFIKATYTVWKHLIRDPLIYDLVEMDSDFRIEDKVDIEVLYPI